MYTESVREFQARIVVNLGAIESLDVFTWDLDPVDSNKRSTREWVREHIEGSIDLDELCRELGWDEKEPYFESVFKGRIYGWYSGPDGEWDERIEIGEHLSRPCRY